ncbi:low affinity immunoglobulin epsilon Fc receptor-like [Mercenaria mercenaria]|uniref:low affinity immunoglobulin epsilon Fc receptor-like n=1 Tax=Mercenaria mercenaria TaxID=6596 RepID=UPI00234F65FE|nr:low affinity immunoglobulin epsilon Fc receptor-like [Mercenaria mercenaria]
MRLYIQEFAEEVGICFAASGTERRIDDLELRLDNALNKTEKDISALKATITGMNISDFQNCKDGMDEVLNDTEGKMDTKDLTLLRDKEGKESLTMKENIKRVYAHVEKNSVALMNEFQKTLTVLMKQHRNINQKIKSNTNNIRKLEQKMSEKDNKSGQLDIAKLEDKLSVLDDNFYDLKNNLEKYNSDFYYFERRLSKLDKKDYDIDESIKKTFHSVASIDHSLVEMDQRYQEFAKDLKDFKTEIRNKIEEIKTELSISTKVEQPVTKTCPPDWVQHGNICYLYNKETGEDWETALRMCKNIGAKLAEPDTKEEMIFLRRFVHGWIGATDVDNEGVFIWESSKEAVKSFPWWPGMPDDHGGDQDCASIWGTMINDEDCSKRYRYVCEKELQ